MNLVLGLLASTALSGVPFAPGASVALDFQGGRFRLGVNGPSYSSFLAIPGASFSNSTGGYAQWSSGAYQLFPANTPRVSDQGILIEESSTTLARNSRFQTWTTSTSPPDGYSCPVGGRVVQTPGVFGSFGMKVVGPFVNDGNRLAFPAPGALAASTAYTITIRARRTRGAAALAVAFDSWGSTPFLFDFSAIPLNQWVTLSLTATTPASAPGGTGGFHTNGVDGDVELAWWNFEQGSFGTSYILNDSTTAAATRSADVAQLTHSAPGTGVWGATWVPTETANTPILLGYDPGSTAGLYHTAVLSDWNGSASLNSGELVSVGAVNNVAFSFTAASRALSVNGGAVVSDANSPGTMTTLRIGMGANTVGQQPLNGYFQQFREWPLAPTNAQMQSISQGKF